MGPLGAADLQALLDFARDYNGAHGISGLLLYQAGYFLQALEGDPAEVEGLYARIERDSRHRKVTKIYDQEVDERSFADWNMGFHVVTGEDLRSCEGYSDVLSDGVATDQIDLANEMTFCMVSLFKQYVRAEQQR